MPTVNIVVLAGHLTRSPELRYTTSGKAVCDIGVAVNEHRGGEETAHFFDVTLWEKQAELVAEHLSKGDPILVEGRLQQDRWQTDDGQNRSKVKVTAHRFSFIGGGDKSGNQSSRGRGQSRSSGQSGGSRRGRPPADAEDVSDSDIPY